MKKRVTDKAEARKIVLEAFRHPTGQIIVPVGQGSDSLLRSQLNAKNVHQSLVRIITNDLIKEGAIELRPTSVKPAISTIGDPKSVEAHEYVPVALPDE